MTDGHSGAGAPRSHSVGTSSHAADRLLANKDRIISLWEQRMRNEVAAAGAEPHLILVNTLPAVLVQIAEALSPRHPRRTVTDGSTVGHEHGGERVRLTDFRIEDVIAEYKILRDVLFEVLEEERPLCAEERHTLDSSLDQLLMEACTGYALVQSRFRDHFFAMMAHDLRNPLNAALTSAALIVREPHAERVTDWASRIIDNINRVDRMVRELLDAMKVQTGARLPLAIKECDLVSLVRQTLERFQAEHGNRFVIAAPEALPGHVAPDALARAVENLVTNALKYGAPSRPITVTVREQHGRVILTVHNHGAHIPVEKQETLFRAFQRLTEAQTSGKTGWGLGLAQVRAVAEAHGGSIGVDSLAERGTTFMIDIPLDARPFQKSPATPAV